MASIQALALFLALLSGAFPQCAAFVVAPSMPSGSCSQQVASRGASAAPRSIFAQRAAASLPVATRESRMVVQAASAVREVTAEELEKEMTDWELPLILDVFAVWCGPCVELKPEMEKVAASLDGKCRVLKMDSDEESEMSSTLNVLGLPTILYMKDGIITHRTEGFMPAKEILQLADIHLFGGAPPEDPAEDLFIDLDSCSPACR